MRASRFIALAALLFATAPLGLHAQQYPVKPLRIIVAAAPGGGTADTGADDQDFHAHAPQRVVIPA